MASYRQECKFCNTIWYDTKDPHSPCPGCHPKCTVDADSTVLELFQYQYENAVIMADNFRAMADNMDKYVYRLEKKDLIGKMNRMQ